MKNLDIDDVKVPAFIARSEVNEDWKKFWPTFTVVKQRQAQALKELARCAYFRSKVYLNAREKFLVIKVDRPHLADKLQNTKELAALHAYTVSIGIEPIATNNSLLFRILK